MFTNLVARILRCSILMRYWLLFFLSILQVHPAHAQQPGQHVVADSLLLGINDQVFVRHIDLSGNNRTRSSIILREINIKTGSTLQRDSLSRTIETTRLRLVNLPLFTSALVMPVVVSRDTIDIHITLTERWYLYPEFTFKLADRNFNVWWKEQNHNFRRANLGIGLRHTNFRGNMEELSGMVQVGYTQQLTLNYLRPYVDKAQKHGIGFSVSFAQNNEIPLRTDSNKLIFARRDYGNYIQHQYAANVLYTYRPDYAVRHLLQLGIRHFSVNDTVLQLNADYFKNGKRSMKFGELQYRLEYNGVDNWNYPLKGKKMVNYVTLRAGFEGFRFQAADQLEAAIFQEPMKHWYTSAILRSRISLPNDQPWFFRRALGSQSEYVRGYEYYVVDGAHYGLLRLSLKRELLNTYVKLPFRFLPVLPIRLYPKVFADAGYAYDKFPGSSFLSNRMLYSAGIGFDFLSAYDIKLRVEWTINHLGQSALYLHLDGE